VTHDQSGLQGGLTFLDFVAPTLVVPHFINGELFAQSIVTSVVTFDFVGVDDVFREHVDRTRDFLEKMAGPDDFTGVRGHVSDDGRVGFLVGEDALDSVQFGGVVVQDGVVFGGEFVL